MIIIDIKIDAEKDHFDIDRFKQRLQEFMELNLAGYYDFSICSINDPDMQKKILDDSIWVVNLFDQANTGHVIELLGNRGKILKGAIDDLREAINKEGKLTILTKEQTPTLKNNE